ncbi:MAG: UPF0149 family protein [Gammaproteobacteria bacterium]|nr:UPF0149 family protein [Gammaproteobacteria bacterium]MDH5803291.1 UPF0149 family protein [Gammaproteobacteria bacterium]
MNSAFDYNLTGLQLKKVDCEKSPGEAHGILCGVLCADPDADTNIWLNLIFAQFDRYDLLYKETELHMQILAGICREQINDPTCDFHLLLPGDEFVLDDKISALADWCQGFLLGLNGAGLTDFRELPEDSNEFIADLLELTRIDSAYDYYNDDEEDAESWLEQFIEYVRVGVLLLNEELHPDKAPPQTTIYH